MKNLALTFLFLSTFFIQCNSPSEPKSETVGVLASKGMVVTAHPLASEVGLNILKKGGNAFDASVAVQFALTVAYPRAGNIGGGGFAVYRKANGEAGSLDFREKAPLKAHRDMYLDEKGEIIDDLSLKGHLAVGVPGSVDGMVRLHQRFGKLDWEEVLQPAIELAKKGVALTEREAEKLNQYQEDFKSHNGPEVFVFKNEGWNKGDTLYSKELVETLQLIRDEGRAGFYEGKTAELIVESMQKNGGIISLDDLKKYESVFREPVSGKYKNYTIISMPPPSSGGIALIQLLKGSEQKQIGIHAFHSAEMVHLMTELERRVYADRATHLGDTDFYPVPVGELLDDDYLAERNESIVMHAKTPSTEIKEGEVNIIESLETTHFSIVDQEGNAVSITTTLNGNYGSKVIVDGAGFFLNNEMDDFSIKAGVPNQFGLVGAEANAIEAEKRMLSSMTPTIVEKNGELFMVVGTPGGSTIITSVYQTILNVTEYDMSMQEAVNAKKVHHQWLPDRILVEKGALEEETARKLESKGHELKTVKQLGKMEAILIREDGQLEGAADYLRGDDKAIGY